jgi:hypothetical protein
MVPRGAEVPVVSETVSTPAGTSRYRIRELSSMKHHEGCAGKILEVPVCDLDLIFLNRKIPLALCFDSLAAGRVPLAPAAD